MEKGFTSTPKISLNNSNLILPRGLVKIYAALSQVLQYSIWISFDWNFSLTKWNCVSIFFVFLWNIGLFASLIELWLSHLIIVSSFCTYLVSWINLLNQTASHVAAHISWYSYFAETRIQCSSSCCSMKLPWAQCWMHSLLWIICHLDFWPNPSLRNLSI